jgi:hypothetical protein
MDAWFVRVAATVGRPLVLMAALSMSAPGEYQLAVMAGWSPAVAWLMPVTISVYAAVAAAVAVMTGRMSALVGAGTALALALGAQVVAHLISAGYLASSSQLVAAVSAVPPVVVAHLLHLATVPRKAVAGASGTTPASTATTTTTAATGAGPAPETAGTGRGGIDPEDIGSEDTGPGTGATVPAPVVPGRRTPTADEVRAAVTVLAADGRTVTGQDLADHFGVSARTGRRYLSLAAV